MPELPQMQALAERLGQAEDAARWRGWLERGRAAFDARLWRGDHYAYDDGGGLTNYYACGCSGGTGGLGGGLVLLALLGPRRRR